MPKMHTFPTLYDECKTVSITKLKEWGYLKPDQWKSGTLTWSRNGQQYASICIKVDTLSVKPYIMFEYNCNSEPVNYKVQLVSINSNIGKGLIWYFLCPNTGKKCRKLYLVNKYFLHREAFKGAMYEKQTYSEYSRQQIKLWTLLFDKDEICQLVYKKYFKPFYKGQPTKRYLKYLKATKAANCISEEQLLTQFRRK
jgi:hypothetical protein